MLANGSRVFLAQQKVFAQKRNKNFTLLKPLIALEDRRTIFYFFNLSSSRVQQVFCNSLPSCLFLRDNDLPTPSPEWNSTATGSPVFT
jgi:hypothetical protein